MPRKMSKDPVINFVPMELPETTYARRPGSVAYKVWMQLKSIPLGETRGQVFGSYEEARRVQGLIQNEALRLNWVSGRASRAKAKPGDTLYYTLIETVSDTKAILYITTEKAEKA